MALTKDTKIDKRGSGEYLQKYLVAATTKIYQGALVAVLGGYLKNSVNGANTNFMGIATEQSDNSAGAAGDLICETLSPREVFVPMAAAAQTDVGKVVYSQDENTIVTTPLLNDVRIGVCVEAEVGVGLWINIRR